MTTDGQSLLQTCAVALVGQYGATIEFLSLYSSTLSNRLLNEPPFRQRNPISVVKYEAKDEWAKVARRFRNTPDWAARLKLPTFEALWEDTLNFLKIHFGETFNEDDYEWLWVEEVEYFGLSFRRATTLVLDELRTLPFMSSWITDIIKKQPKYVDVPSNLPQQVEFRSRWGSSTLPDLHHIISAMNIDHDVVESIIKYFGPVVHTVANYAMSLDAALTEEILDNDIALLVRRHRIEVSNPFSTVPISVRQQLAHINLPGTCKLLLADTAEIMTGTEDIPLSEVLWRLFHKFVQGLLQTAMLHGVACISIVRDVLELHDMEDFLNATALPVPDWTCTAYQDLLEPIFFDDEDEDEEEDDYEDLPDVCFEPAGPDLRVEDIATAVSMASDLPEPDCSICMDDLDVSEMTRAEVPIKLKCGHCLHYGCLKTLINGVSGYSNRCPNCRQEIAPRRAKRLKDDHLRSSNSMSDSDRMAVAMASQYAEEGSNLRDKEGDVVMTDD